MSKERDWVDYANLGSNIFQNLQLNDVQNKLGAMAAVAQQNQAIAASEDHFREAVFRADIALRQLRALPKENRQGVLALVREVLANFERYHITSEVFRVYEDKQRLQTVIEGHQAFAVECAKELSPAECEEAELCVKYRAEQEDLDAFIDIQPVQKELEQAKAQLQTVEKRIGPAQTIGFTAGLMSLFCFVFGVANDNPVCMWLSLVGVIPLIAAVVWESKATEGVDLEQLKTKIASIQSENPLVGSYSIVSRLDETFDDKSIEELVKIRDERNALIAKVMKVPQKQASKVDPRASSSAAAQNL